MCLVIRLQVKWRVIQTEASLCLPLDLWSGILIPILIPTAHIGAVKREIMFTLRLRLISTEQNVAFEVMAIAMSLVGITLVMCDGLAAPFVP